MCETFELAKEAEGPVLIHVMTQKEEATARQKTILMFSMASVLLIWKQVSRSKNLLFRPIRAVFGNKLIQMAEQNEKIVAVSAAMFEGTGLEKIQP